MVLTTDQLEECYTRVGDDATYMGRAWGKDKRRKAADCVVAAFQELVNDNPSERPTNWQINVRCQQKYGSVILIAILSGLISWCVGKLLDYLWELWIEEQKRTEH